MCTNLTCTKFRYQRLQWWKLKMAISQICHLNELQRILSPQYFFSLVGSHLLSNMVNNGNHDTIKIDIILKLVHGDFDFFSRNSWRRRICLKASLESLSEPWRTKATHSSGWLIPPFVFSRSNIGWGWFWNHSKPLNRSESWTWEKFWTERHFFNIVETAAPRPPKPAGLIVTAVWLLRVEVLRSQGGIFLVRQRILLA